ncbi:MAG: polysaccharide biosynthesis C-terminal domain-containing protein [Bacteroidales bacterium]|nr:polysaccharide biosynthesis C-terminal domain-containing protein [Candidatus Cacconaster equi]
MSLYSNKLINHSLFFVLISTVFTAAAPLIAVFVDGVFTSNLLGKDAFNAINLVLPISNLVMVLTLICNMGGSLFAARAMAVGDHETQNKYFTASLVASVAVAWLAIAVIGLGIDRISTRLCPIETGAVYFKDYLSVMLVYFVFLPFATTFNNMVQMEGYPKLATQIVIAANIVNVILDYVFIVVLHWGIKGAAWATVASGLINVVLYLPYFARGRSSYRLKKLMLKDGPIFKKMFIHGVGFNIFYIMTNLLLLMTNKLILSRLGSDGMLIYGVCTQIQSLTFCVVVGMNIGGIAEITALSGEHDINGVKYTFRKITAANAVFYLLLLLLMAIAPALVASCFGIKDPDILSECRFPFTCYCIYYLCFAMIAVHTTLSYQLNGHVGAKAFYVFGLGIVVYLLMLALSFFSTRLMWLAFPVGGITMLMATLSFGYRRYLKDRNLTTFSLFNRYPDDVRVNCTVDYAGKDMPEMLRALEVFQDVCELKKETRYFIEMCAREFCDEITSRRPPLFNDVFNVSFSYRDDEFVMTFKNPGAPFQMKLDPEEMNVIRNTDDISVEDIRKLIINGLPDSISFNYQFGLNVTQFHWRLN